MRRLKYCVPFLLALAACDSRSPTAATVLWFAEQEAGVAPYRTRMLVTAEHLRIDDGEADGDFVLYSRRERTIYNVNVADKLILVIRAAEPVSSPVALRHEALREAGELPEVAGRKVVRYRLRTNGQTCYEVFAADGLLPEATAALREFITALAADQAARLPAMPRELQTPCYLANNAYAAARYLDHGLPVRRADYDGRVSELVDFTQSFAAEPGLFQLPEEYRRMEIAELRKK
jgi:hypothetical protein